MADRSSFGFETTAKEVLEGIDLTGRRALVTGASGGLGAETARVLARAGAAVTLTARDVPKAEAVADAIRSATPGAELDVMAVELQRPESVRRFAKEWLAKHPMLHLLVNNAGVMGCPLERTDEGWEMQFATCHLGHFLLTALLVPALRAGAPARIVNVSSGGHRFGPVRLQDPHFQIGPYDKWVAYGQAKTANVLHAVELDRRLAASGVRAFAIHPGAIVTELGRHLQKEDIELMNTRVPGGMKFKPVEAGAATQVYAATAPELEDMGGLYLEDVSVAGMRTDAGAVRGYMPWAVDLESAAGLWSLSEDLLGEQFPL